MFCYVLLFVARYSYDLLVLAMFYYVLLGEARFCKEWLGF
jgi:hypothetical protein